MAKRQVPGPGAYATLDLWKDSQPDSFITNGMVQSASLKKLSAFNSSAPRFEERRPAKTVDPIETEADAVELARLEGPQAGTKTMFSSLQTTKRHPELKTKIAFGRSDASVGSFRLDGKEEAPKQDYPERIAKSVTTKAEYN